VGPINIADQPGRFLSPVFRRSEDVSEETEVAIDREVKAILTEAHEKARAILREHRSDLDELSTVLLEKESLGRADLEGHFGRIPDAEATAELTGPRPAS
jgi:ATP-dependent Zn protease